MLAWSGARDATVAPVSSILHPVGPEPPGVYWLRRAAFVLAIFTLGMGAWWAIDAIRSADDPPQDVVAAGSSSASPAASPAASAAAQDSAQAGESSKPADAGADEPSTEPTVVEDTVKECTDAAIQVEAETDARRYPVGGTPRFTMKITNIGDVACERDVGTKANEMEVTSGGYHVWSSDDCATNSRPKVVTLQPGDVVASSITWDGRLSQKGCPATDRTAKAGRYDLIARNGEVRSEKQGFALTNPDE